MTTFADSETARTIIKKLYPEAKDIILVEHGYDNLVVLVDKKYAVRFPKYEGAYLRSQYEKEVLEELSFNGVKIPRVISQGQNPPYLVTTFVPGHHISSVGVNNFSQNKQKKFGEEVAKIAYAIHTRLSVEKARELRKRLKLDEQKEAPWPISFENVLFKNTLPTKTQDKLAKEYFKKWQTLTYSTPEVVIHDDLHTENMLFDDDMLVGILDFGDTNIGHPEQELRQLYRINDLVLVSAVKTYEQLSSYKLNLEAIKIWGIMQELESYAEKIMNNKPDHPSFVRAAKNLNYWLPEGNWEANVKITNASKQ